MRNQCIRTNVIIINKNHEFINAMIFMIIHKHQFSLRIKICIRIFDKMFQKFNSYLIANETVV